MSCFPCRRRLPRHLRHPPLSLCMLVRRPSSFASSPVSPCSSRGCPPCRQLHCRRRCPTHPHHCCPCHCHQRTPFAPPPGALAVATLPVPGGIVNIVATKGLVLPPPRERAMWAWVIGEEGGNVRPQWLLPQRYPYRAPLASPCLSLPGHPKGVIFLHRRRN